MQTMVIAEFSRRFKEEYGNEDVLMSNGFTNSNSNNAKSSSPRKNKNYNQNITAKQTTFTADLVLKLISKFILINLEIASKYESPYKNSNPQTNSTLTNTNIFKKESSSQSGLQRDDSKTSMIHLNTSPDASLNKSDKPSITPSSDIEQEQYKSKNNRSGLDLIKSTPNLLKKIENNHENSQNKISQNSELNNNSINKNLNNSNLAPKQMANKFQNFIMSNNRDGDNSNSSKNLNHNFSNSINKIKNSNNDNMNNSGNYNLVVKYNNSNPMNSSIRQKTPFNMRSIERESSENKLKIKSKSIGISQEKDKKVPNKVNISSNSFKFSPSYNFANKNILHKENTINTLNLVQKTSTSFNKKRSSQSNSNTIEVVKSETIRRDNSNPKSGLLSYVKPKEEIKSSKDNIANVKFIKKDFDDSQRSKSASGMRNNILKK